MPPPSQSKFAALQQQISAGIALAQANTGLEPTRPNVKAPPKRKRVPTEKGAIYAQEIAAEKENIHSKAKRTAKSNHHVELEGEPDYSGDKHTGTDNPIEVPPIQPRNMDFNEIRRNSAFSSLPVHTPSPPGDVPSRTSSILTPSSQPTEPRHFGHQLDMNIQDSSSPLGVVSNSHQTLATPMQPHHTCNQVSSAEVEPLPQSPPRAASKRPRSPSVSSIRTRSCSPQPTMSSTSAQQRSRTSRHRPKLQDLPVGPRIAVLSAIQDYRSRLATSNPFPTPSEENTMAGATLVRACVSCLVNVQADDFFDTAVALIIARDSQMRGELKSKLAPLVQSSYGFQSLGIHSAIAHNRKRHDLLKSENRLAFKDFKKRQGLYENPIIQQAINTMWFRNSGDEGIKYAEYFNPIPLKTIALILTTVEHIVDRWASGTFKGQVAFAEKEYADVYERHLRALEELNTYSEAAAAKLLGIQKRLYSRARRHAGLTKDEDVVPLLDEEDLEMFAETAEEEPSSDDAEVDPEDYDILPEDVPVD